jgi:UDP-GlcNAc:undecaprenyl-phosphate GlcNAc-1-phosphate transferase
MTLLRRGFARPADGRSVRAALRRIVEPDREHIHHRLLAIGWSARQIAIALYIVTTALSLLALATAQVDGR